MTDKIQVGDILYKKVYLPFSESPHIEMAAVKRLNKTFAVMSNGCRVILEYNSDNGYQEKTNPSEHWKHLTEDIINESKSIHEKNKAIRWFLNHKFTENAIVKIYKISQK
jgi:hypothetical protein